MKIGIAQQNYHIGNFDHNTTKIIEAITQAKAQNVALLVFPELAVCGYSPLDLLEAQHFIHQCQASLHAILPFTMGINVLIGCPTVNTSGVGKTLHNSALWLYDGKIVKTIHKSLLPTYDVFDEYRHFEPGKNETLIQIGEYKIAVTICEDIWQTTDYVGYAHNPLDVLMAQSPHFIVNLSASPFHATQNTEREKVATYIAQKYQIPLIYCNTVGAHADLIFDGGSFITNPQGSIVHQLPYFEEKLDIIDVNVCNSSPAPAVPPSAIQLIHQALLLGISDYFNKMGFAKAVVASSGGIDSAVVLALAVQALGKENVLAILMPSGYSSAHSVDDAVALAHNLGVKYEILPIHTIYDSYLQTLSSLFEGHSFNHAEENLQSRIRGALVMAVSNKLGHILLNTSNKSELATGYGTLYGDMAGGLSVIGDLYKTQVYALAHHINTPTEIIPQNIIHKAPSAELRPNQKDADSLPEYDVLDAILYQYIEEKKSASQIIADTNFPHDVVNKAIRLTTINEYKRHQFCPILRVSSKAFGRGRKIPIVSKS